jgi:glutamate-ammonia-ligase adenylyltransferase
VSARGPRPPQPGPLGRLLSADRARGLAPHLARLPDPDAAVALLDRLKERNALPGDAVRLHALLTIGGCSPWLAGLLEQDPEAIDVLPATGPAPAATTRDDLEQSLARFEFRRSSLDPPALLRRFKEREYLRIAVADFLRKTDLSAVVRSLSLLADVLIDRALRSARARLEARHGEPSARNDRGEIERSGFVVLALGKLGGEELNYSSDIDLIYLFDRDGETRGTGASAEGAVPNRAYFARLAADLTRLIGDASPGGEVFRVDLNLRPGGRDGDLAISLNAAVAYYRNWAEPWERQALMKARPVAGDVELGRRFLQAVEPLVYAPTPDPYLPLAIGAMKDRIDARLSETGTSERDVKLGRGGIRELEFAVQALQLQRGGADPWLRQGNTLLALHRLATRDLVGVAEYASLGEAYTFLRDTEHRLQLGRNRQTALLPADPAAWAPLARSLFLPHEPQPDETRAFAADLERHRDSVRAFYDSVIGRAAQRALGGEGPDLLLDRMDDAALPTRLAAFGFADPTALTKPLQSLRRLLDPARLDPGTAQALRRTTPALLQAALESPSPRRALQHLEEMFSALQADPASFRRVTEKPERLAPMVRLAGRSELFAALLRRQPELLAELEDRGRRVRGPDEEQSARTLAAALTAAGPGEKGGALRRWHQAELAGIVLGDLNRQAGLRESFRSLSHLADRTVDACLLLARDEVFPGAPDQAPRIAAVGLGRLGSCEMDYDSDLDLLFLCEPEGEDTAEQRAAASRVCEAAVRLLSTLSRDGQLYQVDLRLRPCGSKGELVASPAGLEAYFAHDAEIWEMQSFLKARDAAGDRELGRRAVRRTEAAVLLRGSALPPAQLAAAVADMRRRQREQRGGPPGSRRLKHGPGGLSDIDFAIEFLQLRHGVVSPEGRDTRRMLERLHDLGHLADEPFAALYEGERFLRHLDHALRLIHGRVVKTLPEDPARLDEVAVLLDRLEAKPSGADLPDLFDRRTAAVHRAFGQVLRLDV